MYHRRVPPAARTGIARALSKSGYCSRSQAAALVRAGHVAVNGRIVLDPETPVRPGQDRIAVDGQSAGERPRVYFAMNKPRGLVTTASDERGRATVYDLFPQSSNPVEGWIGPVGRLDKASEGLLLFTNDSLWAARITDPQSHLPKTYHVQIDRIADSELLARLQQGVRSGSDVLRARSARLLREGARNSWLEITLEEGKNRHIRRLLEGQGVEVLRLVRVAIGPLQLGELKKGELRPLSPAEKQSIDRALDSRLAEKPQKHDRRVPRNVG